MEKIIQKFINHAVGYPLWNVRRQIGSMLIFEVGRKVEESRGEFHFWVNCGHWWLQQGKGKEFEDIVHSESSKKNMDEKILVLNGKKLLHVQINRGNNSIIFDFEENLFLRIAPYGGGKVQEQLYVFTPNEILSFFSNGKAEIKAAD